MKEKERQRMLCEHRKCTLYEQMGKYRKKWTGKGRERFHVKVKSWVREMVKEKKMYKKNLYKRRKKKVSITEHIRLSRQGQQDPRQNISLFI